MYFLSAQILFALWAIVFAHFQVPILKDRKDYVPINSKNNAAIHSRGLLVSSFMAVVISLAYFAITKDWKGCLLFLPLFYAWYRIFFDGVIGLKIHDDFYFLGTTAKQDIWFNTHFPNDKPGKIKDIFCIMVIIALNLIKFLYL